MSFILLEEISCYTYPFIDDLLVKSVTSRYQHLDGLYKTIPDNQGIWHFIWKHLQVVHWILQWLQNVGTTVSIKKFVLTAFNTTIVRYKCTFNGHIPHKNKVQKICNWSECQNLTQVCGFLGVCGVLQIFIWDFAFIACPLVNLAWKGVLFKWREPQQLAMQHLKDTICHSPTLCCLDYEFGHEIILAVDTSVIAVEYILS